METYQARALIKLTNQEVIQLLNDDPDGRRRLIKVVFDDGEIETDNRKTIFSSFCWKYHRCYPDMPITISHHIGNGRHTSDQNVDLCSVIYFDCLDHYGDKVDPEELDRISWEIKNEIHNDTVVRIPHYAAHLCYDDYMQVVTHPGIHKCLTEVEPNYKSIRHCHDGVKAILMSDPSLSGNPLISFLRSSYISMSQLLQCIAPKGPQTEINSDYYKYPIMSSFMVGLRSLYESAIESRSATKALMYSKDQVEKGEYYSRRMQLGCSVIQHLFKGDCGTDKYLVVKMSKERLRMFEGKYQILDDGSLRSLTIKDNHLIDKIVKVRSSIHCHRLIDSGICETCFGYLSKSVVKDSNLGHVCATELCKDASQAILSVKHDDNTSDIADITLGEVEQTYLEQCFDATNQLRLVKPHVMDNLRLVVEGKYLRNLMDIMVAPDLTKLALSNTSSIYECELWFVTEDGFDQVVRLTVANGSRLASFTYEFLQYLKEHKWTASADDRYIIDMKDWQLEDNFLILPIKHANMIEFIMDIETFTRSSGGKEAPENRDRLINHIDLDSGLLAFGSLVASKLQVNIAHLEVIVASSTARSTTDSRFPRCASEGVVLPYEELIRTRSLTTALAYEHLERIYGVDSTYLQKHRAPTPMDDLMMPLP